jgi:hypothetical protein
VRKKRDVDRFSQAVSTLKKSQARVVAACRRRKSRHESSSRRGAGGRPWPMRIVRAEVAEMEMPRPRSSPTLRL